MTSTPTPSERDFQAAVLELAALRRWRAYHTHDSRRSAAGFPDVCAIRDDRLIFAELKSMHGRVAPEQAAWLGSTSVTTRSRKTLDGRIANTSWACPSPPPRA